MKSYKTTLRVLFLLLPLAGLSTTAWGTPPDAEEPTSSEPGGGPIVGNGNGLGPNEISLGNTIQTVCPRLVNERLKTGADRGPGEIDLQRRCTEVAMARSRGVDTPELNQILRELNIDEAAAQNRGLVELASISTTGVIARLKQLRLADAGGREGEAVAYREGAGALGYRFETGGAAGDEDFGRWSIYLNGDLFSGSRDQNTLEAGFDVDGGRITAGADYRADNNTFVGASLDYITSSADFDNGSKLDTDGVNVTLYGTHYSDDGLYFEGTIGLGRNNYDQDRRFRYVIPAVPPPAGSGGGATTINQVAKSSTDGDQFSLSAGVGKDIDTGNGMTANFSATLSYLDASVDGFTESIAGTQPGFGMGLRVRDQDIQSLRSIVGGRVSKAISTQSGVVVPFAGLEWLHEFKNDSRTIVASFVNDNLFETTTTFGVRTSKPDQDYFRLSGGASAVFAGGLQGFISVDVALALDNFSYYGVTAGIRKEL